MLMIETLKISFPKFFPPFGLIIENPEKESKNPFSISLPIAGKIRQEKKGRFRLAAATEHRWAKE
jgi:hypothetical protein